MTEDEARAYFIDNNERIISVAKDENIYNYETQQIEDVFMRRTFEANESAIKALERKPCKDAISREAVIDAIITLWADKPFGNPALTEIKECVERVPSLKKMNKWIGAEVLDEIRAEIEKKHARSKQMSSVLQMNAYTDCLQIIDKFIAESEG